MSAPGLWIVPHISPQFLFTLYLSSSPFPSSPPNPDCAQAGKDSDQPATHTPGWRIRTRPPAACFHPLPVLEQGARPEKGPLSPRAPPPFSSYLKEVAWGVGRGTNQVAWKGGEWGRGAEKSRREKEGTLSFSNGWETIQWDLLAIIRCRANQFRPFWSWSGLIR